MLTNLRCALIRFIAGSDLAVIANMNFTGNSTITPKRPGRALYTGCHFDMRERTEPLVFG